MYIILQTNIIYYIQFIILYIIVTLEGDSSDELDSEIMVLKISDVAERNDWIIAMNEHILYAKNLGKTRSRSPESCFD